MATKNTNTAPENDFTREDFKAEVIYSSKELTAKERIQIKDTSDCIGIDEESQTGTVQIEVDYFAAIKVHNEHAENKDYTKYVIKDKSGVSYATSSTSFWRAFKDIYDELKAENLENEMVVKVIRKPSKNYKGKDFMSCVLV